MLQALNSEDGMIQVGFQALTASQQQAEIKDMLIKNKTLQTGIHLQNQQLQSRLVIVGDEPK